MAQQSNIGWTDGTENFFTGCKKVSEGCKFCYFYRDFSRWKKDPTVVKPTSPATFNRPMKWHTPIKVFTSSYSDFFIDAGAEIDEARKKAWQIIKNTPHLTWQILTKRPENIYKYLPDDWGAEGYANVWLGTSIEMNKYKNRIQELIKIPASVHFISFEPLLENIELKANELEHIEWVIVGGESGNGKFPEDKRVKYQYRVCEVQWLQNIVDFCTVKNIPVFVKQLGTHIASQHSSIKSRAGSKIEQWQMYEGLQVQQFPVKKL